MIYNPSFLFKREKLYEIQQLRGLRWNLSKLYYKAQSQCRAFYAFREGLEIYKIIIVVLKYRYIFNFY
jgi:hypothetical protein